MLYLDNAATSFEKPRCFYRAMTRYTKKYSVNAGHGGHSFSVRGTNGILNTAELLCELLDMEDPERLVFCQNASMALNMAIGGMLAGGGHCVLTQMEHNSVLRPVHHYGNYTIVPADREGRISAAEIGKAIREDTKLVICTHISNVSGTIQPITEISAVSHAHGIPLLVDAAQSAGAYPFSAKRLGADMVAFSAHKGLLGPLGVGGLYVSRGVELEPVLFGGTGSHSRSLEQPEEMPDRLMVGTVNTPAIMALGASVKYLKKRDPAVIADEERRMAKRLIEGLMNMPHVKVFGITDQTALDRNGTVLFQIDGMESGEVADRLDQEFGIAVRGGWHCAYPAHCALKSEKYGGVRASFGAFTPEFAIGRLLDAVYQISKTRV